MSSPSEWLWLVRPHLGSCRDPQSGFDSELRCWQRFYKSAASSRCTLPIRYCSLSDSRKASGSSSPSASLPAALVTSEWPPARGLDTFFLKWCAAVALCTWLSARTSKKKSSLLSSQRRCCTLLLLMFCNPLKGCPGEAWWAWSPGKGCGLILERGTE